MVHKVVTNADAGDADTVGGDDWDNLTNNLNRGPFPHTYTIVKSGSTYYALTPSGESAYNGSTLDPVVTSVLSAITQATGALQFSVPGGGSVYIADGVHTLSGSFAGWNVPSLCTIEMAANCIIYVPNAYASYVFKLTGLPSSTSAGQKVTIRGGTLREQGTPSCLWTGILVSADNQYGVFNDTIENIGMFNPGRAIHLRVDTALGWGNGNVFRNIMVSDPSIAIVEFDYNGQTPTSSNGFHRNQFTSIEGQAGSHVTYGYKNIHGIMNTFDDCKIWDIAAFNASGVSANITANAHYTRIKGGIMTSLNFEDLGTNTWWDDDQNGYVHKATAASNTPIETVGPVRMTGLGLQSAEISPPTVLGTETVISLKQRNDTNLSVYLTPYSDARTNTLNISNLNASERLYIQRTGSSYVISTNKDITGGTMRDVIFQTQDLVTGPTTTEVFRLIASSSSLKFSSALQNENYVDVKVISAPASPAAGYLRLYPKTIDANNEGLFVKEKVAGSVVEVQYT